MILIYRASSKGNPYKEKLIQDRLQAVQTCFNSLKESFKDVPHKRIILLDKPTPEFREIFQGEQIEESFHSGLDQGNIGTFHRQIDIALEAKDDFMFIEDDYLFTPKAGKKIQKALETLSFITPYNHPLYEVEEEHKTFKSLKLTDGDLIWKTVLSTTLTFGGKWEYLKQEFRTMKKYGWADHPMWVDITQRVNLYAPEPTLATHIESDFLAKGVDWNEIVTKY